MSLEREAVIKVASLARLRLSDAEIQEFGVQLNSILDYVGMLDELDVSHIEPMVHAIEVSNVLRDDVIRLSLSRDAALSNAPKSDGRCFLVPAIIEG